MNSYLQDIPSGGPAAEVHGRQVCDIAEAGTGPALPGGGHLGAAAGRLLLLHGVGGKFKLECEREEGGRRSGDGRGDRSPAVTPPLRRRQCQPATEANGWNERLKASVLMLKLSSFGSCTYDVCNAPIWTLAYTYKEIWAMIFPTFSDGASETSPGSDCSGDRRSAAHAATSALAHHAAAEAARSGAEAAACRSAAGRPRTSGTNLSRIILCNPQNFADIITMAGPLGEREPRRGISRGGHDRQQRGGPLTAAAPRRRRRRPEGRRQAAKEIEGTEVSSDCGEEVYLQTNLKTVVDVVCIGSSDTCTHLIFILSYVNFYVFRISSTDEYSVIEY